MIFAEQLRAARALLGWNQQRLAERSKVGIATIRRIEAQNGPIRAISETVWRLQNCLTTAGIEFIDDEHTKGPGVRFSAPASRSKGGVDHQQPQSKRPRNKRRKK